jgi:hypothetical protein
MLASTLPTAATCVTEPIREIMLVASVGSFALSPKKVF